MFELLFMGSFYHAHATVGRITIRKGNPSADLFASFEIGVDTILVPGNIGLIIRVFDEKC